MANNVTTLFWPRLDPRLGLKLCEKCWNAPGHRRHYCTKDSCECPCTDMKPPQHKKKLVHKARGRKAGADDVPADGGRDHDQEGQLNEESLRRSFSQRPEVTKQGGDGSRPASQRH